MELIEAFIIWVICVAPISPVVIYLAYKLHKESKYGTETQ